MKAGMGAGDTAAIGIMAVNTKRSIGKADVKSSENGREAANTKRNASVRTALTLTGAIHSLCLRPLGV